MKLFYRLVLQSYPSWFRSEYGDQLAAHLTHQRSESKYQSGLGACRFWWDVSIDALRTNATLRTSRVRDMLSRRRRASSDHSHSNPPRSNHPGRPMLETILTEVKHAIRGLMRSPGYAFVFIVTLGLGIGANTAIFSAVNGVLLRPLPHDEGHRLVYFRHSAPLAGVGNALFSVPEINDYRQGSPSLASVAEFSALSFTMLGLETPRRVRAGIVTGNYFEVMGLSTTRGRTITTQDDGEGAPAVIVLSERYWKNAFGADPNILGTTVEINGRTATFVGIAEPAPPYPEQTDIYVNMATSPHHLSATMNHDRIHRMTEVFARLEPDATVDDVRAEVSVVTDRIHQEHREAYDEGSGFNVAVTPLKTQLTSRARPTLLFLLGTALLVLLIACANLANLTLTRVIRRGHELSIRVSLGGSRAALRRSLLVESLLLTSVGALLGLGLAAVGLDLLVGFAERFTSRASEIRLDGAVFGFAFFAALVASLFFTLLPPLPDGDRVGSQLTRSGTRTTGGSKAKKAQRALVVAQIATSFVLLIGAGLLLRSMIHLNQIDPGFDTAHVLSMNIPPNTAGRAPTDIQNQYLSILREVRALPGVEGVALTSVVPFASRGAFTPQLEVDVENHQPPPGAPHPRADFRVVSPGYFATMGIAVIEGREFTTTDVEDAQEVLIINESMARAYFGDRDPIGKRIAWTDDIVRFMGEGKEFRTVVGVVADTKDVGLDTEIVHTAYNPYEQITPFFTNSMVIRMTGNAATVLPAVREVVLAHDPNQPIENVATIAELGSESVAPRRLNTILLGAFAVLALIIAAVGIGGVLAFSVGSRTREFGVRSALGAARRQVWTGVLTEGVTLAAIGITVGIFVAGVLTRFMTSLLYGVPTLDPITFVAVGIVLAGTAILASWIPAWRAAGVSPLEAMRSE